MSRRCTILLTLRLPLPQTRKPLLLFCLPTLPNWMHHHQVIRLHQQWLRTSRYSLIKFPTLPEGFGGVIFTFAGFSTTKSALISEALSDMDLLLPSKLDKLGIQEIGQHHHLRPLLRLHRQDLRRKSPIHQHPLSLGHVW